MKTIDELIRKTVAKYPNNTALRIKTSGEFQGITYRQLWDRVERVSGGLRRWGLQKGDRIAILGATTPLWIASYLGSLQCGGIVVPVDKELKAGELRHILDDCGARLLFSDPAYVEPVHALADDLSALEKIVVLNDDAGNRPSASHCDRALGEWADAWRQIVRQYNISTPDSERLETLGRRLEQVLHQTIDNNDSRWSNTSPRASVFNQKSANNRSQGNVLEVASLTEFETAPAPSPCPHSPQDTAVILYTSGTTGRSKGAMLSHANIVTNIESAMRHLKVGESMHTLSFLPINHVFEQVAGILAPLSLGGKISIAESLKKIGQNLAEEKPTYVMGVPAVYRLLLARINRNIEEKFLSKALFSLPLTRRLVTSKVRALLGKNVTFISGGAALDPAVAKGITRLGIRILQGYGITETSPIISAEAPGNCRPGSVGCVIPGVEVRIDHPNEEGVGEILVKGPNVMQGYYKRPRETAEAIVDGWYRTGDLGHLDEDGFLSIRGRMKNLIVTPNGKNVYPEEVENELLKSPFIAEVMVYGHKLSTTSEEVHAIIYPDQDALDKHAREARGTALSEADVQELIRVEVLEVGRRLADYKRVKRFTLREDEFPKTTTRKIKRYVVEADIPAEG